MIAQEVFKLIKEAVDPEFEDTTLIDQLRVIVEEDDQGLSTDERLQKLRVASTEQKLELDQVLLKSKEVALRSAQNGDALGTVKQSLLDLKKLVGEKDERLAFSKVEKQTITDIKKKTNANSETLKQVMDLLEDLKEKSSQNQEPKAQPAATSGSTLGQGNPFQMGDLNFQEFIMTALGHNVGQLFAVMSHPEIDDWSKILDWWKTQKDRWINDGQSTTMTMYRAMSWYAGQFLNTWRTLLNDFMTNPFQLSLQEICFKIGLALNALTSMGIVKNHVAEFKWAEPFLFMGES